jgi:hypothetical protein
MKEQQHSSINGTNSAAQPVQHSILATQQQHNCRTTEQPSRDNLKVTRQPGSNQTMAQQVRETKNNTIKRINYEALSAPCI